MKFVAISDTHCRHRSLKLPKGDVIIHAGDISYQGERSELEDFLKWFSQLDFEHKIFIGGNHDFFLEKAKPTVLKKLIPENVTYLKDCSTELGGIKVWGSPYTPWYFNWAFNKHRGLQMKKQWSQIPDDTTLLLTHGPAFGILDTVINERHVGCKELLDRVMTLKPKVHVFGHIHESYGSKKLQGVRFYNACMLNESYELVNKPIVFEL